MAESRGDVANEQQHHLSTIRLQLRRIEGAQDALDSCDALARICVQQADLLSALSAEVAAGKAALGQMTETAAFLRRQISCEHLHHDRREYHDHTQPCPVIARIDAALSTQPPAASEETG